MLNLNDDFIFLMFLGLIVLVCGVAAFLIWKKESIERQQEIESGNLIVIEANPKKAWPIWLLNTILLAPLYFFVMWMEEIKHIECSHLFEINVKYLSLILAIWVMPLFFSAFYYYQWVIAKKAQKNGYLPPLDSVCMFKTDALSLKLKRVRFNVFVILYILPVHALSFYVISIVFYTNWGFDRDYAVIEKSLESKCLVIRHYP